MIRFTGKEHDDEIKLNYFGARYLDPMLGMWISVDPKKQFASPYLYAGNGYNPVNAFDPDGNKFNEWGEMIYEAMKEKRLKMSPTNYARIKKAHDDPNKFFRIKKGGKIDRCYQVLDERKMEKGYKETYEVTFIAVDDKNDPDDVDILTYVSFGHELEHGYERGIPGHNRLEGVPRSEYLEHLKNEPKRENPDPIYLNDYKSVDEMGGFDENE